MEKEFKKTKIATETNDLDIFGPKSRFKKEMYQFCSSLCMKPTSTFTHEEYEKAKPIILNVHMEFITIEGDKASVSELGLNKK